MLRVIDTPGIPDPDPNNTVKYFDAIVEEIRGGDAINLLVIIVKEDRTSEGQFEKYRTLLKQFRDLPCMKYMVCRQPVYSRPPSTKSKRDKTQSGKDFVLDILRRSHMVNIPWDLFVDGWNEDADKLMRAIVATARLSQPIAWHDTLSIRTWQERKDHVERMSSRVSRGAALENEIKALNRTLEYETSWLEVFKRHRGAIENFIQNIVGDTLDIHKALQKWIPKPFIDFMQTSVSSYTKRIEELQRELESAQQDETKVIEAQEELLELKGLLEH
ncbi:unnamed protein product [Ascophyllum nodosum]